MPRTTKPHHSQHQQTAMCTAPPSTEDPNDPWHITSLARRASEGGLHSDQALFLVGDQDILAPPTECRVLANIGGWRCDVVVGAAHNVAIEQPELWREAVLGHLDA